MRKWKEFTEIIEIHLWTTGLEGLMSWQGKNEVTSWVWCVRPLLRCLCREFLRNGQTTCGYDGHHSLGYSAAHVSQADPHADLKNEHWTKYMKMVFQVTEWYLDLLLKAGNDKCYWKRGFCFFFVKTSEIASSSEP